LEVEMSIRFRIAGILALGLLGLALGFQQASPTRSIADVANHLSRASGFMVYVDSRVAKEQLPWPAMPQQVSEEKLEEILGSTVTKLSKGAVWAKLYLPSAPKGKAWKADDVVAYARAQGQLFGNVGAVEPGTIEILGQRLPTGTAKGIVAHLNLKPVYVVTVGRGNFGGTWKTTFGEMVLKQVGTTVSGQYTNGQGTIQGIARGDRLEFRWFEQASQKGGPGYFVLAPDGEAFAGEWAYDESRENVSKWDGTRVSRS